MLRRVVLGTAGAVAAMPITAFADDKYKAVYDDEVDSVKNPLPGTIVESKPTESSLSRAESKLDKALKLRPSTQVALMFA